MKVFLTFMALFIVNVNMLVFHDDLRIYNGIKGNIENAAENCAHGASAYFDLERYAEGSLVYDRDQAVRLINDVVTRLEENDAKHFIVGLHVTSYFYDESGICHVLEDGTEAGSFEFEFPYICRYGEQDGAANWDGKEIVIEEPSVGVFIKADIRDPFRQPFIGTDTVTGYCIYGNQPD